MVQKYLVHIYTVEDKEVSMTFYDGVNTNVMHMDFDEAINTLVARGYSLKSEKVNGDVIDSMWFEKEVHVDSGGLV